MNLRNVYPIHESASKLIHNANTFYLIFDHSSVLGCLLLSAGLLLLGNFPPAALHHHPKTASPSFSIDGNATNRVTVIVVGATGDLAAKYLWVSMFRLALEGMLTLKRTYRFFAGAKDSLQQGTAWLLTTTLRIESAEISKSQCPMRRPIVEILLTMEFKPSVHYVPLWTEAHYRELFRSLVKINANTSEGTEEGRILYLAIPPQYFVQSCELIHCYLRPQQLNGKAASFLRVVVEKPFGRDYQSAHDLAKRLRTIYTKDELYVMDHFAGKPVVRALGNFLKQNAAALHPVWNSDFIDSIYIEMLEKATVKNRMRYFNSAGIIRDVMVTHLQLLLNLAVSPSFARRSESISFRNATEKLHTSQLRFIKALEPLSQQESLFVAQYEEYAAHLEAEMRIPYNKSHPFTPTASSIELSSSLNEWRHTTFHLAAAKATAERLVSITITFRDGTVSNEQVHPCTLTIIIQRAHNADSCQNHRMESSCDVSKYFQDLQLPSGGKFLNANSYCIITSTQVNDRLIDHLPAWELGDEMSAYDVLLREVASGAMEHFADLDEVEAAWALWTPVVNAAESIEHDCSGKGGASRQTYAHYPSGTTPWNHVHIKVDEKSQFVKEDL